MPLIRTTSKFSQTLQPQRYTSERELQDIIEKHPELLVDENEARVALVSREFVLPSGAGRLDLLLVDETGRLSAVEVKLERNGQSRREVFAQVFDYASALAEYQVTELNENTGGGVEKALRQLLGADNPNAVEDARLNCDRMLRAGSQRVVIAVDSAPDDLVRIVRFANDHSDLDIRLVEIEKYVAKNESIFVPRLLVQGNEHEAKASEPRPIIHNLIEVVRLFTPPSGITVHGRARHYRAVRVAGWPASMHYEFLSSGDQIHPELHLESKNVMRVAPVVEGLAQTVASALPECNVQWVTPWQRVGGRLRVSMPNGAELRDSVAAMYKLIELTKQPVASSWNEAAKLDQ
ncbi:hypothetical protein PPSIR1_22556 [Plesiocystis pacifica SIR-1]|uniref:DUF91 domain-containing protein n=1 Tax=Plesiocystis pacifica SIR-1 TaxID=391625 RepID=A6G2D4_9BACT|nr:endonuclease NucS domain-containing protein [Plesiocystis pacifica]EDM79871.1 hypothetical protein PPSIR1_22556 [Plesiocystis pacifica SIR-1]